MCQGMLPLDAVLISATRAIVVKAIEGDTLHELSKAKVRSTLEKELNLEEGTLKAKKRLVSDAVDKTIAEKEEQPSLESPKRKRPVSPEGAAPGKSQKKIKANQSPTKTILHNNIASVGYKDINADKDGAEKSESELSVLIDEPRKRKTSKKPKKSSSKSGNNEVAPDPQKSEEKSESEMSVLVDDKPRKKRQLRTSEGKKPKENLSKNDETIKKYKALVVACGVRKQWSKEFAGLDTEAQQISRLKHILSDLGMSARMSMEQAKAIREKRELKAEIEDVVKFERAKGVNASRATRNKAASKGKFSEDDDSLDEKSDGGPTTKRKPTVARSILAFLGDQSDSD